VNYTIGSPFGRCLLCGISLILLAGCGSPSNRAALQGTVTLNGKSLKNGNVQFLPQSGTGGPSAGGRIADGSFSIDRDRGVFFGTFRVEITASRKTGRKIESPLAPGQFADEIVQYLPECYNRQSELTAEVTKAGPNQFEFALVSP